VHAQTNNVPNRLSDSELRSLLDCSAPAKTASITNRLVDYDTFLTHAADVGKLRSERRVSEEQFMTMSAQPATAIFDARSDDKYKKLHIKGARHLSFTDITATELARVF